MTADRDNGIYYFVGHITPHILHALPLWRELGGTVVVTSSKAKLEIEQRYDVPIICLDNSDTFMRKSVDRVRPRLGLPPKALMLDKSLQKTFKFLENDAKVVIFYELFEFTKYTILDKPKTIFLAHGSSLKNFMAMYPRRQQIVKDYDYMAGLGPAIKQDFIRGGVDPDKLVDIGVARTDELYKIKRQKGVRNKVAKELGFDPDKKIVSYFTTFWGPSSIYGTAAEIIRQVDDDYILLFQLHPQVPKDIRAEYDRLIGSKPNVYATHDTKYSMLTIPEMMSASDLLLGDVSSLVLEEILMNKPMIFCYGESEHRQADSDYRNIRDVVAWSEHLDENNANKTNQVFATALKKGINKDIWRVAKDDNFYHHNGDSVRAIVDFINSIS